MTENLFMKDLIDCLESARDRNYSPNCCALDLLELACALSKTFSKGDWKEDARTLLEQSIEFIETNGDVYES